MNSETGQIYRLPEEIKAAQERGEPLEPIGPGVAEMDKHLSGPLVRMQAKELVQARPNGPYFDSNGKMVSRRERRKRNR